MTINAMSFLLFDPVIGNMYGPYFLLLYASLMVAAYFWLRMKYRNAFYQSDERIPIPVSPDHYELAYLRAGTMEVIKLATYNLLRRSYLISSANDDKSKVNVRKSDSAPPVSYLNEIEKVIFNSATLNQIDLYKFLRESSTAQNVKQLCRDLYDEKLQQKGMTYTPDQLSGWTLVKGSTIGFLLFLGVYKFLAASVAGHKNLLFLLILMIVVIFVGPSVLRPKKLAGKGAQYLQDLQNMFRPKYFQGTNEMAHEHLLLMAGIYGMSFLENSPHGYIDKYFAANAVKGPGIEAGGCGSGSACSSSGSCGSSCGGCGGCGGD